MLVHTIAGFINLSTIWSCSSTFLALQQNLWVTQGSPIALTAAKTKREKPFGLSTTDVMGDTTGE
jgi:hypothetical protein